MKLTTLLKVYWNECFPSWIVSRASLCILYTLGCVAREILKRLLTAVTVCISKVWQERGRYGVCILFGIKRRQSARWPGLHK